MSAIGYYQSPIGLLMLHVNDTFITQLTLVEGEVKPIGKDGDNPIFMHTFQWLDDYFANKKPEASTLPLAPSGTAFQLDVWRIVRSVPYGSCITYGQIAQKLEDSYKYTRMSAQAIGQAVGANPIAIIIPCHRVLGRMNKLTGYAYGLYAKKWLLSHEKIPYKE